MKIDCIVFPYRHYNLISSLYSDNSIKYGTFLSREVYPLINIILMRFNDTKFYRDFSNLGQSGTRIVLSETLKFRNHPLRYVINEDNIETVLSFKFHYPRNNFRSNLNKVISRGCTTLADWVLNRTRNFYFSPNFPKRHPTTKLFFYFDIFTTLPGSFTGGKSYLCNFFESWSMLEVLQKIILQFFFLFI